MSLSLYDEALVNKFKEVFGNVVNSEHSVLFERASDEKAEIQIPMISIWRITSSPNLEGSSDPFIRRGYKVGRRSDGDVGFLKSYPMKIIYQVDIWSDLRIEVDDIYRELLMFLFEEPNLTLELEELKDVEWAEDFYIRVLDSDLASDFAEMERSGILYRNTILLEIENARLFFTRNVKPVKEIPIRYIDIGGI